MEGLTMVESDGILPLSKGEKHGIFIGDDEIEDLRIKGSKCLVGINAGTTGDHRR